MTEGKAERRIRRNRFRRQRQLRRRVFLFTCIMLVMLSLAGGSFIVRAQDACSEPLYKYYTSISIEEGDTLWSVAEDYGKGFDSGRDFIQEVIRINHLTDENLRRGDHLIVPYYSRDFRQ